MHSQYKNKFTPKNQAYGEAHHRAKHSNETFNQVISDYNKGVRVSTLSKIYNVPYHTVCGWCYGKYRGRLL